MKFVDGCPKCFSIYAVTLVNYIGEDRNLCNCMNSLCNHKWIVCEWEKEARKYHPENFEEEDTGVGIRSTAEKRSTLEIYQSCINKIDDFLEYRWEKFEKTDVRSRILGYIDELSEDLNNRSKNK